MSQMDGGELDRPLMQKLLFQQDAKEILILYTGDLIHPLFSMGSWDRELELFGTEKVSLDKQRPLEQHRLQRERSLKNEPQNLILAENHQVFKWTIPCNYMFRSKLATPHFADMLYSAAKSLLQSLSPVDSYIKSKTEEVIYNLDSLY
ncbi:hypothetical protein BTVI_32972 [Pitangus sulphuratus]|nr:hypothetical protein BTVI_32972 [Pitangus sulphuratus]